MKKLLLIASCIFSLTAIAQKRTIQLSIAGEGASMATKQAYTVYNLGFGGSAKVLYPVGKKDFLTGTLMIMNFSGKSGSARELFKEILGSGSYGAVLDSFLLNTNIAHPTLTIFTPKVGYKHFLNNHFNAEAEIGYCIASVKKLFNNYPGNIGGWDWSAGFGYTITKKVDIGLRYEMFESTASDDKYTAFVALRTMINLDFK